MTIRNISVLLATLLLATASLAANESISIPDGGTHEGNLETRNGPIRIGNDAIIDGSLESRNGHIETGSSVTAGDVYTRNGAVVLGEGGRYGRIESRNGRVELGSDTVTGNVETRNGSISIGARGETGSLHSRNGGISVGPDAVVDGTIETRNGGVSLQSGSRASGQIKTRNGSVSLHGATAEQGIRTLAGDILLEAESRSGGDVIIEITEDQAGKNSGFFGLGARVSWPEAGDIRILGGSEVDGDVVLLLDADYDERIPVVEIASDAVVTGNVRVDSRVELLVEGSVGGEIERISP